MFKERETDESGAAAEVGRWTLAADETTHIRPLIGGSSPEDGGTAESGSRSRQVGGEDLMRLYLRDIGKIPLLTARQEIEIGRRIEIGQQALREAVAGFPLVVGLLLEMGTRLRRVARVGEEMERRDDGAGQPRNRTPQSGSRPGPNARGPRDGQEVIRTLFQRSTGPHRIAPSEREDSCGDTCEAAQPREEGGHVMTAAIVIWIILVVSPAGEGVAAMYPTEEQCVEGRAQLQEATNVFISNCVSVPVQLTGDNA